MTRLARSPQLLVASPSMLVALLMAQLSTASETAVAQGGQPAERSHNVATTNQYTDARSIAIQRAPAVSSSPMPALHSYGGAGLLTTRGPNQHTGTRGAFDPTIAQ